MSENDRNEKDERRAAMADPATYTTPPGDDTPSEPPPPAPQGDGTPGDAPGTPSSGERLTGEGAKGASRPASAGKPPSRVTVSWDGEHRFDIGRTDGGPPVRADASAATGPSPVDLLVGALASCVSVDVVDILAKRRTPVESLTVQATAQRANAVPGRVVSAELAFTITGAGIERVHAERAIELAVTKYCSVRDSLDPAIPVTWTLEVNG